jgi:hypothetical protein
VASLVLKHILDVFFMVCVGKKAVVHGLDASWDMGRSGAFHGSFRKKHASF